MPSLHSRRRAHWGKSIGIGVERVFKVALRAISVDCVRLTWQGCPCADIAVHWDTPHEGIAGAVADNAEMRWCSCWPAHCHNELGWKLMSTWVLWSMRSRPGETGGSGHGPGSAWLEYTPQAGLPHGTNLVISSRVACRMISSHSLSSSPPYSSPPYSSPHNYILSAFRNTFEAVSSVQDTKLIAKICQSRRRLHYISVDYIITQLSSQRTLS